MASTELRLDMDVSSIVRLRAELLPLFEAIPEGARQLVLESLLALLGGFLRCEAVPAGEAGTGILRLEFALPLGVGELFAAALRAAELKFPEVDFHGGPRGG